MSKPKKEPESPEGQEASFFAGGGLESEVERVGRRSVQWRSPVLMLAVAAFSIYLAWTFRPEVEYFLSSDVPVELGDAGSYDFSHAVDNRLARVHGLQSHVKASYKQLFRQYKVYYLIGTRVFVREVIDPDAPPPEPGAGEEDWPTFDGSGRLIDLRTSAEFANIRAFYETRSGYDFSQPSWILLSGVEPGKQWQYLLVVAVLFGVAIFNLVLLVRRLRGR